MSTRSVRCIGYGAVGYPFQGLPPAPDTDKSSPPLTPLTSDTTVSGVSRDVRLTLPDWTLPNIPNTPLGVSGMSGNVNRRDVWQCPVRGQ